MPIGKETSTPEQRYREACKAHEVDVCDDFLESLQIAIVRACGNFKTKHMLRSMSVSDLANICTRNFITASYMWPKDGGEHD